MTVKTILRRAALLVAISALGLFAATVAVANPQTNPQTMYTCVKVTNGVHEVENEVPESALNG